MPLTLYNTLTRRAEAFAPGDPAHVTFYTCGPTVYDDAHIGNFRSFLAADVLRRWIEHPWCELVGPTGSAHAGPRRVTHVMNITDVGHMTDDAEGGEHGEDRMAVAGRRLLEAKKSGALPAGVEIDPADPYQIARFYEARFREDARRLGLKVSIEAESDPTLHPRATDAVPGMIAVIARLIEKGHAYAAGGPGERAVYFRVLSFPGYGRLSGNTLDALRAGEGGRVQAEHQSAKEHPADFLLWKEDARHLMKWESPWGWGYPGWHIECSVMSFTRLVGPDLAATIPDAAPLIDLHSGGEDNIFPHHESELAQSCCAFNADPARATFARMWFHPRFLFVEGRKMSKSLGNFFTARDLFAKGFEPAAVRLELIRTHYRSNADFREQGLRDSQRMIDRWRKVAEGSSGSNPAGQGARDEARLAFTDALNNDLNLAAALAAVNAWAGRLDRPGAEDAALMRSFDAVLGVLGLERPKAIASARAVYLPGVTPSDAVEALLAQRADAKAARDFTRSDVIRDQLASMGYAIKDVAGGKVEVGRR
ncbi:MAG: cysteine--tRNA ligase [Phycisphaeraceae bacterium]|nr:MAG: cysteine--tRNA ligase [Phycisphaeraceae bacterium]